MRPCYAREGRVIFDGITLSEAESAIQDGLDHALQNTQNSTTSTITLFPDDAYGSDLTTLSEELADIRTQKLGELMERVNSEFVLQVIDTPQTGLLSGTSNGQKVLK